jgi:hypothetical protein
MQRPEAKNPPERPLLSAETGNVENRRQDPRRNGVFSIDDGFRGSETALTREFARHVFEIAALLRVPHILYNYRVWVVETIWTKLHAPHAEIEPVSETRARNGIFCCRDRAAKWAHSRRLHEQRPR